MDSLNDSNLNLYDEEQSTYAAVASTMLQGNTSTTVDWSDHDIDSSMFSPDYTYSNDKYSCLKEFYTVHMAFNYIIFLSGIACMVTRLIPASNKYNLHAWFGRIYILGMLWTTSASLLINNDGLPVAVLVSFAAVMGGLTIGWIVIIIYKQHISKQATDIVQNQLINDMKRGTSKDKGDTDINLNAMMTNATMEVVNSKTFAQRFFSLKSLHGILFFVSWMQIAGRMFNSGDGQFACRTYPTYKPIEAPHIPDEAFVDADQNKLKIVYVHDPNWEALPWSNGPVVWALLIILASAIMAIIGGVFFSFFFAWRASKNNCKDASPLEEEKEDQIDEREETIENNSTSEKSMDASSL